MKRSPKTRAAKVLLEQISNAVASAITLGFKEGERNQVANAALRAELKKLREELAFLKRMLLPAQLARAAQEMLRQEMR